MDYNIFHLFFRHGITFKEVSGESEKVTKEMTAPWEGTTLPTVLARYQLKDIFNADEFVLFYEALSSKSLHFRGKRCSGGKHSKVRLTGLRLTPLVRRSRCLWLENLPVQDASSTFVTSLADIDLKRKHEWMGHIFWGMVARARS